MIDGQRPHGPYYEQVFGDKMLFLDNVDHLRYDIIEQGQIKKQEQLEKQLTKLKNDRLKESEKLAKSKEI